jgi:histidine kinase/DNA gyrase B/HSP90-like ATPase
MAERDPDAGGASDDVAAADLAERNRHIVAAYRAGESMVSIAARHGLSAERVRQLVRRADGRAAPRRRKAGADGERLRLRIGNLAKAVLVTGQAYQDPKDALNEFVSNAADDYAEAGMVGERIGVLLRRRGARAVIAVDDAGRGMDAERLRQVARNLFESAKAGDDRTLGEKAIGLLAFQQLGARCDVVSRSAGSDETWTLRLRRGEASAELVRERRRARSVPGTTVFIAELDNEAMRVLTRRKVVDYLRRRRGQAIGAGAYTIEVVEGRTAELVTAEEPDGLLVPIPARDTLWGRLEFALFVAADADPRRHVAVVGRAGTTIIDDIAELEEFDHEPWTSGRLSGRVSFDALRQTAGRRAVLRDDDIYPAFHDAVESVEPLLLSAIERVRAEVDAATADRLSDALRQVFGRVLKELADLENPMRTLLGDQPGEGADAVPPTLPSPDGGTDGREELAPSLDDLEPRQPGPERSEPGGGSAAADGARSRHLPSIRPDPEPGHQRSRFDAESGTVLYNESHADFLLVKDDEAVLLDYLATLVAKEYVVYNNPRAATDELAEELVRMLVRVRRHLPPRARRR